MKKLLLVIGAAVALLGSSGAGVVMVVIAAFIVLASVVAAPVVAVNASCRPQLDATQVATYGWASAVGDERAIAGRILDIAQERELDGYAAASALVGTMTMTGLRDLPDGGLFDVNDGWAENVDDVDAAVNSYFDKMIALRPEYHSRSVADLASALLGQPAGEAFRQNEDAAWSWLVKEHYPLPESYQMPINVDFTQFQRGFRYMVNPSSGARNQHHGVDLSAPGYTPILAMADGNVVFAGDTGSGSASLGYVVIIEHPELGIVTVYAHIWSDALFVHAGDTVEKGDEIAGVGASGGATGTHLHFEIRQSASVGNAHLAPYDWLYSGGGVRAIGADGQCIDTDGDEPAPGDDPDAAGEPGRVERELEPA